MADRTGTATPASRPKPVRVSHSFPRLDTPPTSPGRKVRSNTLQEQGIPAIPAPRIFDDSQLNTGKKHAVDVFEADHNENGSELAESGTGTPGLELHLPSTFDDLPIEIKSLTERFLDGLSAKVHPIPLTADSLSSLFQDFYERAAAHIATHIASLSSRIGRDRSPVSTTSSRILIKTRSRAGSGAKRTDSSPNNSGGEMLTASEVTDRKRARRLLELKRLALEEAVERAVCEKVYDKIWKHKSTDDDARDEKLRSRTAALALVGIGLKELHVDALAAETSHKAPAEKEEEIHHSLADAREALQRMDNERYPLGKLRHLTAAHKSIVDTLSQLFPSSSSADEILPTLIYTLITSPPEGINVVSNLSFIQRFRASSKVDGEAAYCMVNLEAAISFLETIDLPSLRSDELPEGPPKSSSTDSFSATGNAASLLEKPPPANPVKPDVTPATVTAKDTSSSPNEAVKALPSPRTPTTEKTSMMHQRRISALMQAQADRIEAGRENLLNTADKIYDSINGTLENSLQFVFGRFKDQTSDSSPLPKTLEDARKLVNSPRLGEDDDILDISGRSSPTMDDPLTTGGRSERVVELIGGKKGVRDRSVDSARSGSSGKRVLFADGQSSKDKPRDDLPSPGPGNLFATINTINPLNRFQVPSFARFGRISGTLPHTPKDQPSPGVEKSNRLDDIVESPVASRGSETTGLEKTRSRESNAGDDLNARETIAELRRLKPPKKRFLDVQNVGELKISEVEELLLDYRRLAKALGAAIAQ